MGCAAAKSRAEPAEREPTAFTMDRRALEKPAANCRAMLPVPRMPKRRVGAMGKQDTATCVREGTPSSYHRRLARADGAVVEELRFRQSQRTPHGRDARDTTGQFADRIRN